MKISLHPGTEEIVLALFSPSRYGSLGASVIIIHFFFLFLPDEVLPVSNSNQELRVGADRSVHRLPDRKLFAVRFQPHLPP